MRTLRRRFALVFLALGLAAAAYAASGSASITVRFKGPLLLAEFVQVDQTGCVVTDVVDEAASGRQSVSGGGTSNVEEVEAFISIFNICEPVPDTILVCSSFPDGPADVSVDRELTTATASGTMTCTNLDTGETCQLEKSETFQGVGEISTRQDHFQDRSGNVFVNAVFRGRTREAVVTSASISGCGLSMSQDDAVFAQFEGTNSVFVQVEHP
jgi:hypothetical protein